jgi:MFS family permease
LFEQRWRILFVLFFARMTMAFQFQSIAALAPEMAGAKSVTLADIGLLIGLYLAPGIVVAIPGGAIAAWLGDKRFIILGMILMLLGSALILLDPPWALLVTGRLLAGAGGVILNNVLTKMLVDWFAGREIATAMGIFITSWPAGIALALFILPSVVEIWGLDAARAVELAFVAIGLALFSLVYRAPGSVSGRDAKIRFVRFPVYSLVLSGLVWGFFNSAVAMVFGFGPVFLLENGWGVSTATSLTSGVMVALSLFTPVGGYLADKTGRYHVIIGVSLLASMALLALTLQSGPLATTVALLSAGALFGLAAGPIMSMPSAVLPSDARGLGMGVFFTLYYVLMMFVPWTAGIISARSGTAASAILLGTLVLGFGLAALIEFRRVGPNHVAGIGAHAQTKAHDRAP